MRMRPAKAPWTKLYQATPDPRGFFEAVLGFGKLEDQWIRISAADQKRYFGEAPFGRRALKVAADGTITVFKTCDFGRDFDYQTWRYDMYSNCWLNGEDRRVGDFKPCNT